MVANNPQILLIEEVSYINTLWKIMAHRLQLRYDQFKKSAIPLWVERSQIHSKSGL